MGWASSASNGVTTRMRRGDVSCGPKDSGGMTTNPESQLVSIHVFLSRMSMPDSIGAARVSMGEEARISNPDVVVSCHIGHDIESATPDCNSSMDRNHSAVSCNGSPHWIWVVSTDHWTWP
ncbi:MAG TPA: hypothetical protein DCS71_01445 [Flavobacteriales bacterium]|nr:hypothetical protein [Flavobacteriales bacterium]